MVFDVLEVSLVVLSVHLCTDSVGDWLVEAQLY